MKKLSAFLALVYLVAGSMPGLAQEMGDEEETSSATLIRRLFMLGHCTPMLWPTRTSR
jgi:hypothetical protein